MGSDTSTTSSAPTDTVDAQNGAATTPANGANGVTATADAPPAVAKPVKVPVKKVLVEAPDEDKARAAAAAQLNVPPAELQLRVLSRQKRGLFGMGGEVLTIEATWRPRAAGAPGTAGAAGAGPAAPIPDSDGKIDFFCERGKLSLEVHRPVGHGRAADITALEKLIEGWPLDARDDAVIQQALRAQDGRPRVFATISPSVQPPEGAAAAVRVAKDDFTAWLIPWNAVPLDASQIFDIVGNAGIVEGLDEELVEHLAGKVMDQPVVIATGTQPRDGKDAEVEFMVEKAGEEKAKEATDQDARVDFRETGRGPVSMQPGDVLARRIPLVPAVDGYTVKGKVLPAKKPKDVDLKRLAGQNTAVSEDGETIVATTSGQVSRVGEKVAVLPIHTVDGDVDFKSGNITFEGNLQIRGGVKPGFKVQATGAVQIGGTVEGSTIEAGGDVLVNGGIVGQKEGVIRAGGSVTARFVQEAEIHAGGAVTVGSEIRESTVISGGKVTVGGQGRIVGGMVRGRDEVELKVAGSQSATPTTIQAGWGESLEVEVSGEVRFPKVIVRNEVQPGVLLTVAGASQRFSRTSVGGVWREKDGKLIYSAN
jgi:uncharacterized protein